MDQENLQKTVQFLVQKNITRLFKSFLDIIEDLKNENSIMLSKVAEKTSSEFTANINYLIPDRTDLIRKKILDSGNEAVREISALLETFNLDLDEKKLEKLINSKKITKQTLVSGITPIRKTE